MEYLQFFKGFDFLKYIKGKFPILALVVILDGFFIYLIFKAELFAKLNQSQSYSSISMIIILTFFGTFYSMYLAAKDKNSKYFKQDNQNFSNSIPMTELEKKIRANYSPTANHRLDLFASHISKKQESITAGFDYTVFVKKAYEQRIAYMLTVFSEEYSNFLMKELDVRI